MDLGVPPHKRRLPASLSRSEGDTGGEVASESKVKSPRTDERGRGAEDVDRLHAGKRDKGRGITGSSSACPRPAARGKETKMKEAMDRLTLATAEVNLECKAEIRDSNGYLERTLLIPLAVPAVDVGLEEAVRRNKERLKLQKGANVGPAHVRIFLEFLQSLGEWDKAISDAPFKAALGPYWKAVVMAMDEEQLREEVQVFRIIKPKIQSKVKVQTSDLEETELGDYARVILRLKPGNVREAHSETLQHELVQFALRMKWKVLVGTAPRSKKERELLTSINEVKG